MRKAIARASVRLSPLSPSGQEALKLPLHAMQEQETMQKLQEEYEEKFEHDGIFLPHHANRSKSPSRQQTGQKSRSTASMVGSMLMLDSSSQSLGMLTFQGMAVFQTTSYLFIYLLSSLS